MPIVDLARHERIKCVLRIYGKLLRQICREHGVGATSVTPVYQEHRAPKRNVAAIAGKLRASPSALWPGRHVYNGRVQIR